ncbi:crossover junction endodeoxyribonuclease RuvC [Pelagicoccus sp. SDUM812003]|uniref:crossover junction endodeoxyribonuclease RuvC n=1 Tax=Pelagicoccus sp. SDUM812003 TaxID=3041267 RepID=UPI00280CAD65|nr:crossover junction endodeoxyribonuclease RuvC [Pelagicoccus sp. SDUM812003]MDQ8205336.1 crossover junction endodeoxyribonuclease RuvC [Pelagicoccus sp. SDUM812003]
MARKGVRQLWKDKVEGRSTSGAPISVPLAKRRFEGAILGIDPSLRGTGLAVVEFGNSGRAVLLHSKTLKLKPSLSMASCLGQICQEVLQILDTREIDIVALEQTIFVQNFQTAQILGAARGAAIAAAAMRGKEVFEYPPLRVKQAVVGHGRASKEQVAKTIRSLLGHGATLALDESDAAAVAFTHAFTGAH